MAPKTVKGALRDVLENLSAQNFDKFCRELLDREEEPTVKRMQVEGKNFLDIADLLVSVFTEAGAHLVAVELLKDINCSQDAVRLERVIAGLSSKPGSSAAATPSAGASGKTMAEGGADKHFVDKHRIKLIDRVSHIAPILDELLDKDVILQEQYDDIRARPTNQEKMRALYSGCLKSGTASKDVFYETLKKNEKFLIEDLEKNS